MDVLKHNSSGYWFHSTKRTGFEDRVVKGVWTSSIPLLPEEVPFDYEFLGDVVFLLHPVSFFAVAESRRVAQIEYPLATGVSYQALFAKPEVSLVAKPEEHDDGYCYRMLTGEVTDLGPYPTAEELTAVCKDLPADPVCVRQPSGHYHCSASSKGVSVHALASHAVLGARMIPVEFQAECQLVLPVSAVDSYVAPRLRVLGAGELRVREAMSVLQVDSGDGDPVNWFAFKWVNEGWYVNMGMVRVPSNGIACARFPGGIDPTVYWLEDQPSGLCSVSTKLSTPTMAIPGRERSWHYVFVFSKIPLPGTVEYPVKIVGEYRPTMVAKMPPWGSTAYDYPAPMMQRSVQEEREVNKERYDVVRAVNLGNPGKYEMLCRGWLDDEGEVRKMELEFREEANYETQTRGGVLPVSWATFVSRVNQSDVGATDIGLYVRDGLVLSARHMNFSN